MLTLTFVLFLIMLALAVMLTPLTGWVRPAVWSALALLTALLAHFKVLAFHALLPIAIIAALGASGCCSTPRCYLAKVQVGLEGLDQGAIAAMRAACSPQIEKECKGKGETCPAFVKCRDALVGYEAGRITMGKGVTETNRALEKAGVP